MKKIILVFIIFFYVNLSAQKSSHFLNKIDNSEIIFDGVVNEDEIKNAAEIELKYEISPRYNKQVKQSTVGYIKYTDKYLYVGIIAQRDRVISNIINRDDWAMYNGDAISVELDTYGDARNQIFLVANPSGSLLDAVRLDGSGYSGSGYNLKKSANFDFKALGSINDSGYNLEFIIPFSEIPFPNGSNQLWNINIRSRNFEDRVAITSSSSKANRDATCQLCLMDHEIILKDIIIEKKLDFLPYITGNFSGERINYNDNLSLDNQNLDYGIGINFDINKNLSVETTINPDFSQVEADVTKIDINSPTAINYPEQRPFFNRGVDALDFEINVFNSRSINKPSFASKILNQGKKSRFYFLTAFDEETPYLVPTEYESYSGVGAKSFNSVLRYQNFIDNKTQFGIISTNRIYDGGGYGNTFGADALFNFSGIWKFSIEGFFNFNKEPIADWIDTDQIFGNYSVKLDGESFNGYSFFSEIRRETETWKSFIQYKAISDDFRSDIGFVTKNDIKQYDFWHSFYQYPNRKFLQNYRVSFRHEQTYDHDKVLKRASSQLYLQFLTLGDTNVFYNYEYNWKKSHLDFKFEDFINHYLRIGGKPLSFMDYNLTYKFGKDIAYRETIPQLGYETNINFDIEFAINNKLRVKPIISYQDIRKTNSSGYYFKGYIGRLDIRYQFNNNLDIRLISEYNDFSEEYFFQPLVSWKPNPDTVFYLGGNQNLINNFIDYNSPFYRVNKSQFFVKLQYLVKS
jgi:hypothetical protein